VAAGSAWRRSSGLLHRETAAKRWQTETHGPDNWQLMSSSVAHACEAKTEGRRFPDPVSAGKSIVLFLRYPRCTNTARLQHSRSLIFSKLT
jgi:hypothetical protein